jgi:hypothetical protein
MWQNPSSTATGGAMQRWEYKFVLRGREFASHDKYMFGPTKWSIADMEKAVAELGDEGWELVSVTPRSDLTRAAGASSIVPAELAGFTTSEIWVFKRPKPA